MKLTDQIKEKIDNAKSEEEAKTILESVKDGAEKAGVILDDDELEKVSGGVTNVFDLNKLRMEIAKFNKESSLSRIEDIENGEIEEMNRKCRELGIASPYE